MTSFDQKLQLLRMKIDILKLKADDYEWQCHTPKDVKEELEKILSEITDNQADDKISSQIQFTPEDFEVLTAPDYTPEFFVAVAAIANRKLAEFVNKRSAG